MATIKSGSMFPAELVKEIYSLVKGKSSIAKMIPAKPTSFTGNDQFTFSLDTEVSIVGESGQKPAGDGKVKPVTVRPIKIVYQSRVSNEFMYASEEKQLEILRTFAEGYSKKIAEGFDVMAMHGVNPATGEAATQTIANNYLDYAIEHYNEGSNVITYNAATPDDVLDDAIDKVDDPTGIILGKTMRSAIAKMQVANGRKYPEFAFGATPNELGGMTLDKNVTVEKAASDARAYVGDWNALRWGFAKEMPLEIIEYGDPDGQGDLKRTNEVVLRSEAFIGWGILDAGAFAQVKAAASM